MSPMHITLKVGVIYTQCELVHTRVRVLYPFEMLSPLFIPESVFHTQSAMLGSRFTCIPESVFYTQSVVHSPQSTVHVLY